MRRVLLVLAACGGSRHQIEIASPPAKMTRGTLVGPLCKAQACTCRDANLKGDGGVGAPEPGRKRFEFRLTSAQELWVTLPDAVLYKSPERAEECFYIDLPSIDVPIELRGSDAAGVSAQWTIRELGTKTNSWYDTFAFACGHPGVCSFEELDAAKAKAAAMPKKGIYDACGSVKIKGLTWDTGRAPDNLHPSELLVRLVLQIYKRDPTREHGGDCAKYQKGEGRGDGAPPEPDAQ
jgi:hypothetical protein